jgi:hypothetical protein
MEMMGSASRMPHTQFIHNRNTELKLQEGIKIPVL